MSPGSGGAVSPEAMRSISVRVENCIVPTKTGSPPAPCAISAPSTAS
jgi:hypothetical protein